jgi:hypothetical protein
MTAPRRTTYRRPPVRIRINRPNLAGLALALGAELALLVWAWHLIPA